MVPGRDDWRRRGQERYLAGLRFARRRYQAYSGNWDHEHCEFCFRKFLDRDYAGWMREALEAPSQGQTGAGYANLASGGTPSGRYWICPECFGDFQAEFEWPVLECDPESWPYDTPEPKPRPTAADFNSDQPSRSP